MQMGILQKIILIAILAMALPLATLLTLLSIYQSKEKQITAQTIKQITINSLGNTLSDIYQLCKTTNTLITEQLQQGSSYFATLIQQSGSFAIDNSASTWSYRDASDLAVATIDLPSLRLGSTKLNPTDLPVKITALINQLKSAMGCEASILQKVNDHGDFLMVASTLHTSNNATNRLLPQDRHAVVSINNALLRGDDYVGTINIDDKAYLSYARPFFGAEHQVIGATLLSIPSKKLYPVLDAIARIKIGDHSYAWVIEQNPTTNLRQLLVQHNNILTPDAATTQSGGAIDQRLWQALSSNVKPLTDGQIAILEEDDRTTASSNQQDTMLYTTFQSWDWIMGIKADSADFPSLLAAMDSSFSAMILEIAPTVLFSILLVFIMSIFIAKNIENPIKRINQSCYALLKGNTSTASNLLTQAMSPAIKNPATYPARNPVSLLRFNLWQYCKQKIKNTQKNHLKTQRIVTSNEKIKTINQTSAYSVRIVEKQLKDDIQQNSNTQTQLSELTHTTCQATKQLQSLLNGLCAMQTNWKKLQTAVAEEASRQKYSSHKGQSLFTEAKTLASATDLLLSLSRQHHLLVVNLNIEIGKESLNKQTLLPVAEKLKQLSLQLNSQHQLFHKSQSSLSTHLQQYIESNDKLLQPTESTGCYTDHINQSLQVTKKILQAHKITLISIGKAATSSQQSIVQSQEQLNEVAKRIADIMHLLHNLDSEVSFICNTLSAKWDNSLGQK